MAKKSIIVGVLDFKTRQWIQNHKYQQSTIVGAADYIVGAAPVIVGAASYIVGDSNISHFSGFYCFTGL